MMYVSKFQPRMECLEDRNAPGGLLDGLTPLAMWGSALPVFDAPPAQAVRIPAASERVPLTLSLELTSDRTAQTPSNTEPPAQAAALPNPFDNGTLDRVVGTIAPVGNGTIQGPGAIRPGFDENELDICDDCRTFAAQNLGFAFPLGAVTFDRVYVYSNGFISSQSALSAGQVGSTDPLDTFGPKTGVILAAFWADVDLRGAGAVRWGPGDVDGYASWGVTWDGVGRYFSQDDLLNTFQLVLTDYSADFGFYRLEYNYGSIQWQTGEYRPELAPRAGFTDGEGTVAEIAGSGELDTLIDDNPKTGLIYYDDGYFAGPSKVPGRHQVDFFV